MTEISRAVAHFCESTLVGPKVALHRAFQTTPPSLVSYQSPQAVDGLEMDVQETADANYVIFHDRRITVDNQKILISTLNTSTLHRLQAEDRPIHKLRDILAKCSGYPLLILDLKHVTDLARLLAELRRATDVERLLLASFDFSVVVRIKHLDPAFRTAMTIGWSRFARRPLGFFAAIFGFLFPMIAARLLGCDAIICSARRISKALVMRAHLKGLLVLVWEEPSQPASTSLARLGKEEIDVIITGNPNLWRSLCGDQVPTSPWPLDS